VVETGRPVEQAGAHVAGFNAHSLGICLVGGRAQIAPPRYAANFSLPQWDALKDLVVRLKREYPHAGILDHRDFPEVAKECPCFDVAAWATREGLAAGIMP
jgi:N-acetylmuramoyl-L-alanine amidase